MRQDLSHQSSDGFSQQRGGSEIPHITGLIETAAVSVGRLDYRRASARREEIGKEATRAWPPVPWTCAAAQLAEAERLIGEQK